MNRPITFVHFKLYQTRLSTNFGSSLEFNVSKLSNDDANYTSL